MSPRTEAQPATQLPFFSNASCCTTGLFRETGAMNLCSPSVRQSSVTGCQLPCSLSYPIIIMSTSILAIRICVLKSGCRQNIQQQISRVQSHQMLATKEMHQHCPGMLSKALSFGERKDGHGHSASLLHDTWCSNCRTKLARVIQEMHDAQQLLSYMPSECFGILVTLMNSLS